MTAGMPGRVWTPDEAAPLKAYFLSFDGTRDLGRGTVFPTSADLPGGLQTGDRFWRSDLGWGCYYDGTRWLTQFDTAHPLKINDATAPVTYAAAGATITVQSPFRNDYGLYITRVATIVVVAATNDATNYWTVTYRAVQTDGSTTTIHAFTTQAFAAGAVGSNNAAPSTTTVITNRVYFDVVVTKTAAPGALTYLGTIHYKYVVT